MPNYSEITAKHLTSVLKDKLGKTFIGMPLTENTACLMEDKARQLLKSIIPNCSNYFEVKTKINYAENKLEIFVDEKHKEKPIFKKGYSYAADYSWQWAPVTYQKYSKVLTCDYNPTWGEPEVFEYKINPNCDNCKFVAGELVSIKSFSNAEKGLAEYIGCCNNYAFLSKEHYAKIQVLNGSEQHNKTIFVNISKVLKINI